MTKKRIVSKNIASKSSKTTPVLSDDSDSDVPQATPGSSTEKAICELSENVMKGFSLMKESFENFGNLFMSKIGETVSEKLHEFHDYECEEENSENEMEAEDDTEDSIFSTISGENSSGEKLGSNANPKLANMMNQLLKSRMSTEVAKAKEDKYPRPKNIEFASVPKTNQPIWDAIRNETKKSDFNVQNIQKNVLKSSLPLVSVMEELNSKRDDLGNIDVNSLISKISDSINFIGSANVLCSKLRKEGIKKDLPKNMQSLCKESEITCPELLFGDDLKSKINEVTELNKIKSKFSSDSSRGRRGSFRGRGTFKYRGNFNRGSKRFNPIGKNNSNYPKNSKNGGQGRGAPSKN